MQKLLSFPPPVIALLLLAAGFGIDRLLGGIPVGGLPDLGLVFLLAGFVLSAGALLNFRRHGTTFLPHGEPSAMVTAGAYLWTRNPMYLGLLTALSGLSLFLGLLPLFLAPVGFFLVIDRVHVRREEAKLDQLFGQGYREYQQRAPRWL